MNSNLAVRDLMTDSSFRMALDAHEITLNKVDASLENLSIEESIVGAPILN